MLQWPCDIGGISQKGTPATDGKLEILQWQKIQQRQPHTIIQTDTSTTGWEY